MKHAKHEVIQRLTKDETDRKLPGSKQKTNTNYRDSTQIGEQAQEDETLRTKNTTSNMTA